MLTNYLVFWLAGSWAYVFTRIMTDGAIVMVEQDPVIRWIELIGAILIALAGLTKAITSAINKFNEGRKNNTKRDESQ